MKTFHQNYEIHHNCTRSSKNYHLESVNTNIKKFSISYKRRRLKWSHSNRNNSDAGCSISLKLGTAFDHVTADTLQTFRV